MNPILCIDPGGSGGMAIARHDGTVEAYPMPEGMTAQIDAIKAIAASVPGIVAHGKMHIVHGILREKAVAEEAK